MTMKMQYGNVIVGLSILSINVTSIFAWTLPPSLVLPSLISNNNNGRFYKHSYDNQVQQRQISTRTLSGMFKSTTKDSESNNIDEEKIQNDSNDLYNRKKKAFPLQTPHSGRHFYPSHPYYQQKRNIIIRKRRRRRRFMEGWYYRLTLTELQASFAFIISIEDPGNSKSKLKLACIQIVGPDDEYLVQADQDDTKFWALKYEQGLGCTFQWKGDSSNDQEQEQLDMTTVMSNDEWHDNVESGFQILPQHFVGRVKGHDGTMGGVSDGQGVPGECYFNFTITPVCGWGDTDRTQKSTGGWLANFAVFEPHWQVTLADARATGTVIWKNRTYNFADEPFYAEKNWGAALPSKWYWTQCNSFEGYCDKITSGNSNSNVSKSNNHRKPTLSVTAGGGIRKIPFGQQEALGMVSVHYNGKFYEAVPWTGTMGWKVATWGSWILYGKCTEGDRKFEVQIEYTILDPIKTPGLIFRAPTPSEGMVYFCKDTFESDVILTLWELAWDAYTKTWIRKPGKPLIDRAKSTQGGAEIGGGPWWDTWENDSQVKQPFKFMLQIPYRARQLWRRRRR